MDYTALFEFYTVLAHKEGECFLGVLRIAAKHTAEVIKGKWGIDPIGYAGAHNAREARTPSEGKEVGPN
jgi:hypothetical protein